jgi:predicted metal-binding protein
MRKNVVGVTFAVAVSLAGCTAIRQQKAMPERREGSFKNLKLLPPNITHDELIAIMRGYTKALGVKCEHCHVRIPNAPADGEDMDFPNDSKPEKQVARVMIEMTRDLNRNYISKVNEYSIDVSCITCHRGKGVPDNAVIATPRPEGQRPPAEAQPQPPKTTTQH